MPFQQLSSTVTRHLLPTLSGSKPLGAVCLMGKQWQDKAEGAEEEVICV